MSLSRGANLSLEEGGPGPVDIGASYSGAKIRTAEPATWRAASPAQPSPRFHPTLAIRPDRIDRHTARRADPLVQPLSQRRSAPLSQAAIELRPATFAPVPAISRRRRLVCVANYGRGLVSRASPHQLNLHLISSRRASNSSGFRSQSTPPLRVSQHWCLVCGSA
ncbi:hypothetical protein B0T26DRAFT_133542 [Lasiosphaeria miniovina]|uniref:Uncharacterized protein n=1 Tax=Lasiosphaeria miniovina TaxID=1954250 RepID=A0AA40B467_9PEZI|nr:uncharacterized protein B0T26DRAFT_133542 [Lasiosphaeria miniovina]KAK0727394.1 hypothetical protein B0T26DRAFT_133542 [Lasiosphaeria miniovina]